MVENIGDKIEIPVNKGRIISIRGPVLDIEFPPGKLPDIYNALEIIRPKDKSTPVREKSCCRSAAVNRQ